MNAMGILPIDNNGFQAGWNPLIRVGLVSLNSELTESWRLILQDLRQLGYAVEEGGEAEGCEIYIWEFDSCPEPSQEMTASESSTKLAIADESSRALIQQRLKGHDIVFLNSPVTPSTLRVELESAVVRQQIEKSALQPPLPAIEREPSAQVKTIPIGGRHTHGGSGRKAGRQEGVGPVHHQHLPPLPAFGARFSASLGMNPMGVTRIEVAKSESVYANDDKDSKLYLIQSGRIKTVMLTSQGKQCVLGIHGVGDIIGETSLMSGRHAETAIAMENAVLDQLAPDRFMKRLVKESLLEDFLKYLATLIAQQQSMITNFVTADSEYRLASLLSILARKFGKAGEPLLRLEDKISHQDLADMVGTTRPRVSEFMQRFRDLGLIVTTSGSCLLVHGEKLSEYLQHRNGLVAREYHVAR